MDRHFLMLCLPRGRDGFHPLLLGDGKGLQNNKNLSQNFRSLVDFGSLRLSVTVLG
jgi:hypothetical protein